MVHQLKYRQSHLFLDPFHQIPLVHLQEKFVWQLYLTQVCLYMLPEAGQTKVKNYNNREGIYYDGSSR